MQDGFRMQDGLLIIESLMQCLRYWTQAGQLPTKHQLCIFQWLIVYQPVQLLPLIHIVRYLILHSDGVNDDHITIGELQLHTSGIHVEPARNQPFHLISLLNGDGRYVPNFDLMPDCSTVCTCKVRSSYGTHLLEKHRKCRKIVVNYQNIIRRVAKRLADLRSSSTPRQVMLVVRHEKMEKTD